MRCIFSLDMLQSMTVPGEIFALQDSCWLRIAGVCCVSKMALATATMWVAQWQFPCRKQKCEVVLKIFKYNSILWCVDNCSARNIMGCRFQNSVLSVCMCRLHNLGTILVLIILSWKNVIWWMLCFRFSQLSTWWYCLVRWYILCYLNGKRVTVSMFQLIIVSALTLASILLLIKGNSSVL